MPRNSRSLPLFVLIVVFVPGALLAYAGEAGSSGSSGAAAVSTHHLHLTRALAHCAGMPALTDLRNPMDPLVSPDEARLAEQLALHDELTDQGTITGTGADGTMVTWSNVDTDDWSYGLPTAADVGCADTAKMVYPILQRLPDTEGAFPQPFWDPSSGWFTHRFGPWAGFFHFPQDDDLADDLETLRSFAMGATDSLSARSLYGFGADSANTWSGSCYDQRLETVATGAMTPGSVAAFATYLHSLGDSYSHRMCRDHWLHRQTPPWYYHTPPETLQATCAFNDHTFEFGCPDTRRRAGFLEGTIDGAIAVYGELVGYALSNGYTPRVPSVDAHGGWLRRQIERYAMGFRDNFDADAGDCRVSFTFALLQACGAIEPDAGGRGCLPDVDVMAGGSCAAGGRATGCPEGTPVLPMTPACSTLVTGAN